MSIELPIDPPEPTEKCYTFTCECTCKTKYVVWAENLEEAEDRLKNGEGDSEDISNVKVEEIISYTIEE